MSNIIWTIWLLHHFKMVVVLKKLSGECDRSVCIPFADRIWSFDKRRLAAILTTFTSIRTPNCTTMHSPMHIYMHYSFDCAKLLFIPVRCGTYRAFYEKVFSYLYNFPCTCQDCFRINNDKLIWAVERQPSRKEASFWSKTFFLDLDMLVWLMSNSSSLWVYE